MADRSWLGDDSVPFTKWRDGLLTSARARKTLDYALLLERDRTLAGLLGQPWPAADRGNTRDMDDLANFARQALRGLEPHVPLAWLGGAANDPDIFKYRARASHIVAVGAQLISRASHNDAEPATYIRMAFGLDAFHVAVGDIIGGFRLFNEPMVPPQQPWGDYQDLQNTCVAGIERALVDFGQAARQFARPWGTGSIQKVTPSRGCPGDQVTISGSGFGASQPSGVTVTFSMRGGGCTSAPVSSWSDTDIVVVVPPDAGIGCVGFVQQPQAPQDILTAADALAGEIENCLGLAGVASANTIRGIGNTAQVACPDCADPRRHFAAGPPVIVAFDGPTGNVTEATPGTNVVLSWSVENADKVEILSRPRGTLPDPAGPLSGKGTQSVGPIGLQCGESAAYELSASNACGTVTRAVQIVAVGKRALVFAGGGSKCSFEIGAARCLHDQAKVTPEIIVGSSIGAINAAKLAEGPAALAQVEALWLGLTGPNDLYLEPQWFKTLEPLVQSLLRTDSSSLAFTVAGFVANFATGQILQGLVSAFGIPGYAYTIMTNIYPVVTGVIDVTKLAIAVVNAVKANALFINAPMLALIATNIDPNKVKSSGTILRITMVSLDTGRMEVVTENGTLLSTGHAVPLTSAVLASASLPLALPPIQIAGTSRGTETFIDGGTRNNIPAAVAADAGAHRIYILVPTPFGLETSSGFPTMLKIGPRAFEVLFDELQQRQAYPYRGFGVPTSVVSPTFLLYDTIFVDPGLIAINMDYGYMRAFDEVVGPVAERTGMRRSSDDIVRMRMQAWAAEHAANGERLTPPSGRTPLVPVADPGVLSDVRSLKLQIRAATKDRERLFGLGSVPGITAPWWQEFEKHTWQTLIPTPWDALSSRAGTLQAGTAPPP